jgi:putative ABC transport system substrate-binding protein
LLGGLLTAGRALRAQQKAMPVVGFLLSSSPKQTAAYVAAFQTSTWSWRAVPFRRSRRQGLNETGWVEGHNVAIEYRWVEGRYDRLPPLVADLVSRKNATSTIPIVFTSGEDPVAAGLVASFPRPGGQPHGLRHPHPRVGS